MPGHRLRAHCDEQETEEEDTVQISEYAFYRLYRADEERLTRDLERRRVARERVDEERARGTARETLPQRTINRLRLAGHPQLHSSR